MSDDKKNEAGDTPVSDDAETAAASEQDTQSGPKFTTPPGDPLAGVKKGAADALNSMEGKTGSMKVYVGSIIGVIVLMLLARCGG